MKTTYRQLVFLLYYFRCNTMSLYGQFFNFIIIQHMLYEQKIQSFLDGRVKLDDCYQQILQSIKTTKQLNDYIESKLEKQQINDETQVNLFFKSQKKSIKTSLKHFKVFKRILAKIYKQFEYSTDQVCNILINNINKETRRFSKLIPIQMIENIRIKESLASSIISRSSIQSDNSNTQKIQIQNEKQSNIAPDYVKQKIISKSEGALIQQQDDQKGLNTNEKQEYLNLIQKLQQFVKDQEQILRSTDSIIQQQDEQSKLRDDLDDTQKSSIFSFRLNFIKSFISQSREKGIKNYYKNVLKKYGTKESSPFKTVMKILLFLLVLFILFIITSVYAVYRLIKSFQGQL